APSLRQPPVRPPGDGGPALRADAALRLPRCEGGVAAAVAL
ncbi:MAG: hypothetical protein AVDCRST_MAG08-2584, partial [uncultured Acetobacteraceae bacterium]